MAAGIYSEESKKYEFDAVVQAEEPVEEWTNNVVDEMKGTLLRQMKEAVFIDAQHDYVLWVKRSGMVALASAKILWTWSVEDAFRRVAEGDKNAMTTSVAAPPGLSRPK